MKTRVSLKYFVNDCGLLNGKPHLVEIGGMGYSIKKKQGGGLRTYSLESPSPPPLKIFRCFTLTLQIPDKIKLHL